MRPLVYLFWIFLVYVCDASTRVCDIVCDIMLSIIEQRYFYDVYRHLYLINIIFVCYSSSSTFEWCPVCLSLVMFARYMIVYVHTTAYRSVSDNIRMLTYII